MLKVMHQYANTEPGARLLKYILFNMFSKNVKEVLSDEGDTEPINLNILSDEDMKDIKSIAERGGPFSIDEVALLSLAAGKNGDRNICTDEDEYDDDVLDKYAEHLRNYVYTYKDAAKNVDPSIDPNQEHIGIMAQDLEKVNPACVETTPSGVKTVNTGRLALMNAGAIGDLARRVEQLEEANNGENV